MTTRKFFRYVVQVEILSESEWTPDQLQDLNCINEAITDGDSSGSVSVKKVEKIDGKKAAKLLMKQASDPEFFQIDEKGNDIEDENKDGMGD